MIWNIPTKEPDPEVIEVPEGHYLELGDGANLSNVVIRGKPDYDGRPGCLRSLLWEAWRNSGVMCDPESYDGLRDPPGAGSHPGPS